MSDAGAFSDPARLESVRITSLPPNFYYVPNFITMEEEASILQKIPAQRWVTLSHRRLQAHPSTLAKNNTLLAAPLPIYLVKPIVERFKILGIFKGTLHQEPNHILINQYDRGEGIMPHEDGGAYAPVVATVSLGAPICLEISPKSRPDEIDDKSHPRQQLCSEEDAVKDIPNVKETPTAEQSEPEGVTNPPSEMSTSHYKIPSRILQEPRSLLITTGPAYNGLLHGIAPIDVDENLNSETVANWDLLGDPSIFEEGEGRNERATRISLTYRDVLKVSSAANKVFSGLRKR